MSGSKTRILLVDQDEGQYSRINRLLTDVPDPEFLLDWVPTAEGARDAIARHDHDACLVGYEDGDHNALNLIYDENGFVAATPIILLSAGTDAETKAYLEAGAADCIAPDTIDRPLLVRAIRNALERKRADEVLYLREQEFKAIVDNSSDVIARFDRHLRFVYVNPAVESATGLPPQAYLGKTHGELGGTLAAATDWDDLINQVFETGQELQVDNPLPGPHGHRYYRTRLVPQPWADGSVRYVLKISRDITERRRIEEQLKLRDRAIEASTDAIVIADAGKPDFPIVYVNPAFERITGYSPNEALNKSWKFLHRSERPREELDVLQRVVVSGREASIVVRSYRKDGSYFWNEMHIAPIYDANGSVGHCVAAMRDITERKWLELEHQRLLADALEKVDRDPLTGLLNHRAFHKRLVEETERPRHDGKAMAVVIMDLNNFRFFNDAYGHTTGDQVLLCVADILRRRCPASSTLARFGGDEFALILPDPPSTDAAEIEASIESILDDLDYRPPGNDVFVPLSLCAGVAFLDSTGRVAMLQYAENRMRHKKGGHDEESDLSQQIRTHLSASIAGFAMLDSLITAVDTKDRYTRRHSEDVMNYSLQIAEELDMDDKTKNTLAIAALLHDIGKTGVPDLILRKPGALTPDEFETVKQHPMMGAAIVGAVPGLEETLDCVRHHHERWDGHGYPFGLVAEECPLLARLMAVADAMSAMTTDRPYRKSLPIEEAMRRLAQGSGTQWDPACVDAMIRAQSKLLRRVTP